MQQIFACLFEPRLPPYAYVVCSLRSNPGEHSPMGAHGCPGVVGASSLQQDGRNMDIAAGENVVYFNACLRLSPWHVEKDFWLSVRFVKAVDTFGLCSSIFINVMLMRKFGFMGENLKWAWHYLPTISYFTAGVVQLTILLRAPDLYQRNRFAINLANRLVKLLTVMWAIYNMSSEAVMAQFSAFLNSDEGGTISMKVLRPIASPPLIWVSHAVNFWLPFWIMLPLQCYTLLIATRVMRSTACALTVQPAIVRQMATAACKQLRFIMQCAVLLIARPASAPAGTEEAGSCGCSDTNGLLLLITYTYTMALLVTPCVVVYFLELSLKLSYIKAKQLRLVPCRQGKLPKLPDSMLARAVVVYTAVVVTWFVCDALIMALPPVSCINLDGSSSSAMSS